MKSGKNITKWASFMVITVIFLSLSYITIHPTLSTAIKVNSIVLDNDFASEKENSDSEKDFSEEYLDLFLSKNQELNGAKFSKNFPKTQSTFLIPRIFYDIQLLPPEVLVS